MADKNPCWKGYVMEGMKEKNGRKVPNCVRAKKKAKKKKKKGELIKKNPCSVINKVNQRKNLHW